ncbi:MAG: HNH endonuclease signature motif containing protein [Anaerostipes hadrus]
MSNRPPIPEAMKRKVRQEAYFGCVKCGCPGVLRYHHIEPWSKVKKHEAKNLVALCPNCHREATVGAYYYEERLLKIRRILSIKILD